MKKREPLSIKSVIVIVIGAALFFVLGRFVSIPSPVPNTTINIQYGVLGIFGVLYGSVVGMLCGFAGHALIDLSWGTPWWSWVIASAVCGIIIGRCKNKIDVKGGCFGPKEMIIFNTYQILGHVISWILIAPVLDVVIYGEPIEKLFAQGVTAAIGNSISTAIVGTVLLGGYIKTKMEEEHTDWEE